MNIFRSKQNMHGSWRILLTLLCIFLVFVCGTIQVVHVHPNDNLSHTDCALCLTAHMAVQVASPAVTLHISPVVSLVEALSAPARIRDLSTFALFTRPPPVDVVAS
jgi:hypothetical protein